MQVNGKEVKDRELESYTGLTARFMKDNVIFL